MKRMGQQHVDNDKIYEEALILGLSDTFEEDESSLFLPILNTKPRNIGSRSFCQKPCLLVRYIRFLNFQIRHKIHKQLNTTSSGPH